MKSLYFTKKSIPFCPYHFVQYHFVRMPFCPYHFVRTILSATILSGGRGPDHLNIPTKRFERAM